MKLYEAYAHKGRQDYLIAPHYAYDADIERVFGYPYMQGYAGSFSPCDLPGLTDAELEARGNTPLYSLLLGFV